MGKQTLNLNETLYEYLLSVSLRDTPLHRALRDETNRLEMGVMQISPDQGQFMALLVKLIGARRIIEIGTFTGYSALLMAEALPEEGRLIACDVSAEWTAMARRYWRQAGVDGKIELRLAPALDTLNELLGGGGAGTFDFAFIDADKLNLRNYYEHCLNLLRPGGLIAVDNVLWGGSVANPDDRREATVAIRRFNEFIFGDGRVDLCMVPIGDGVTLARKRG